MKKREESDNPREIALDMLLKTLEEGAMSHLVIKETLDRLSLDLKSRAFLLRLYHGVLEKEIFLSWILQSYSRMKLKKMKPVIRILLLEGLYQMLFMDSVPDHAAIFEAVTLAKRRGYSGLSSFVNGVLRNFQRNGIKPGMPEYAALSAPSWLYEKLAGELGKQKARAFFESASEPRDFLFARMRISVRPAEEIIALLENDGCVCERVLENEEAVKIRGVSELKGLQAFQEGLIFVQDLSSMEAGRKAFAFSKPDEVKRILDVCAAPGGKSLHLADLFPDAEVISRDISKEKISRIRENIERLSLSNVKTEVFDAVKKDASLTGKADLVLADLPCSGIGVIGRKPDIKRRLMPEDIPALSALQKEILSVSSEYVREGGILLYSTCTLSKEENGENAAWFAAHFPFALLSETQYLPPEWEGDGFYIAVFKKEK